MKAKRASKRKKKKTNDEMFRETIIQMQMKSYKFVCSAGGGAIMNLERI